MAKRKASRKADSDLEGSLKRAADGLSKVIQKRPMTGPTGELIQPGTPEEDAEMRRRLISVLVDAAIAAFRK
jgi:hypothetical protein